MNKCRHQSKNNHSKTQNIWNTTIITSHTKIRLFNSTVKSVLFYVSATWRTTKETVKRRQTFSDNCLRRIVQVHWPDTIWNMDLQQRTSQHPVKEESGKDGMDWTQAPENKHHQINALAQWKRKRGRPRYTLK